MKYFIYSLFAVLLVLFVYIHLDQYPFVNAQSPSSLTLLPSDDAYINASSPAANYQTATTLKVSNGTYNLSSYLKFDLSSLKGLTVTHAVLQIYPTNGSSVSESIKQVTGSWSESTLNYNNRPSLGPQIASINPVASNINSSTDITSAVVANSGGSLSLEIDTQSSDSLYFNSKENSSNPPQLIITYGISSTTTTPVPSITSAPSPTPIPPSSDPTIMAAGDIACDPGSSSFNGGVGTSNNCHQKATSDLILNNHPAAVLPLGDNQYYCGGYSAFIGSYDPSWGRFKNITHPAVGNHEYLTSDGTGCDASNVNASGYYQYFGSAAGNPSKGYYSYDVGSWHIVSLNTQCSSVGGCGSTSPQYKWLQSDLSAHNNSCTLAYYHIPLYSSGGRANNNSKALYQLLYDNHTDVILTGHDHTYERFAPQDANGNLDQKNGIVEFVVGTGGADHTSFVTTAPNSLIKNSTTFGVLKLTLHSNSYDWQFLPEPGKSFTDSGSASCH